MNRLCAALFLSITIQACDVVTSAFVQEFSAQDRVSFILALSALTADRFHDLFSREIELITPQERAVYYAQDPRDGQDAGRIRELHWLMTERLIWNICGDSARLPTTRAMKKVDQAKSLRQLLTATRPEMLTAGFFDNDRVGPAKGHGVFYARVYERNMVMHSRAADLVKLFPETSPTDLMTLLRCKLDTFVEDPDSSDVRRHIKEIISRETVRLAPAYIALTHTWEPDSSSSDDSDSYDDGHPRKRVAISGLEGVMVQRELAGVLGRYGTPVPGGLSVSPVPRPDNN